MTSMLRDTTGAWPPGTWRFVWRNGVPAANISCPKCGIRGGVGHETNHAITPDGQIVPSVVCEESGCDFHDHVKLIGWPDAYAAACRQLN